MGELIAVDQGGMTYIGEMGEGSLNWDGHQKIRTIKRCINENKELFNYYDKEIFENNGIIIVELIL